MKWLTLYKKIGKQDLSKIKKADVYAIIDNKNIPLVIKYDTDGLPYLVPKEEHNLNYCKKCANYNMGDGIDDITKCTSCNYR